MIIKSVTVLSVFIILSGMLSACGPRMSTVTEYIPPVTDSGLRCVARTNHDRTACESDNNIAFEKCKKRAYSDTEQAFVLAQNEYTRSLEIYIMANERYEQNHEHFEEQKRLLLRDGDLKYIRCSNDVKMEKIEQFPKCKKFLNNAKKRADKLKPPRSPIKPYAPSRKRIFDRNMARCNDMINNCEQSFNQAYQACGGTVSYKQVCVSNCKE